MSRFKRKFSDLSSFATFDARSSSENVSTPSSLNPLSKEHIGKIRKQVLGNSNTLEFDTRANEIPSILKNLRRLEDLVQAQKFQEVRQMKKRMENPGVLRDEYMKLLERYKKVKGKCSMTPCRIPRSGLDIKPNNF